MNMQKRDPIGPALSIRTIAYTPSHYVTAPVNK